MLHEVFSLSDLHPDLADSPARLSVYARADFILHEAGEPWFLEINTLPGMTPTSLLPQEAAAVGIDYPTLCQRIVNASLEARKQGK